MTGDQITNFADNGLVKLVARVLIGLIAFLAVEVYRGQHEIINQLSEMQAEARARDVRLLTVEREIDRLRERMSDR